MKHAATTTLAAIGLVAAMIAPPGTALAQQTQPKMQHVQIYVLPDEMGLIGPDKQHHDSVLPADFALKAGEPVEFTIVNYDDMAHSITAPGLGLNVIIKPGKHVGGSEDVTPVTTSYTFTPAKKGQFRWHCIFPCDKGAGKGWAMTRGFDGIDHDGFMAGYIDVL